MIIPNFKIHTNFGYILIEKGIEWTSEEHKEEFKNLHGHEPSEDCIFIDFDNYDYQKPKSYYKSVNIIVDTIDSGMMSIKDLLETDSAIIIGIEFLDSINFNLDKKGIYIKRLSDSPKFEVFEGEELTIFSNEICEVIHGLYKCECCILQNQFGDVDFNSLFFKKND